MWEERRRCPKNVADRLQGSGQGSTTSKCCHLPRLLRLPRGAMHNPSTAIVPNSSEESSANFIFLWTSRGQTTRGMLYLFTCTIVSQSPGSHCNAHALHPDRIEFFMRREGFPVSSSSRRSVSRDRSSTTCWQSVRTRACTEGVLLPPRSTRT